MEDSAVLVGATLGHRFRLESHLGSGGMGDVFRGTDDRLRRPVALKIFSLADAGARDIRRYADEARVLAGLSHPSLVTLYDVGADTGPREEPLAFLVMELVDGPTLQQRIAEGPLGAREAADVGRQLADALGHAHAAGVVHRDIKPANVLITDDTTLSGDPEAPVITVKLADFGIAQSARGSAHPDARPTEATLGTASYLSPEQALGQPLGPASDVYSLGLVLLEALTGERAYSGAPLTSSLARLIEPVEVPRSLGRGWAALLTAMLSPEPAARPTPAAVADRLRTLRRAEVEQAG
ncbi:serine/threonine-protein kinase [Cellulomonas sp. ATA003]|uniref:serine/threonine-protein kinase n=1 Tax=Cellulomonas sp. ATA003 TaxID=3073064 RepID=UPI0028733692|nr:serine/threonine-protein kinase [Cellulomonas sp. ATA003]WNB86271.1 serine/threonine-protein kinase [Cellulomonas sp. ATA003]